MAKTLGIDDAVNTCDCCGKTNLKSTVIMQLDDGEIVHYGSVCAGRNTGKDRKTMTSEIKQHRIERIINANDEYTKSSVYEAYVAKCIERNSFSYDDPRKIGKAAYEFIKKESLLADDLKKVIANKYGLFAYEF